MGLVFFKKVCYISFILVLLCYYISAFRLIHTTEEKEAKKERHSPIELKDGTKKPEILDVIIPKERYKDQSTKIQHIKAPSKTLESDEIEVHTKTDKKIKSVPPTQPQETPKDKLKIISQTKLDHPKKDTEVITKSKSEFQIKDKLETKIISDEPPKKPSIKEKVAEKVKEIAKPEKTEKLEKVEEQKIVKQETTEKSKSKIAKEEEGTLTKKQIIKERILAELNEPAKVVKKEVSEKPKPEKQEATVQPPEKKVVEKSKQENKVIIDKPKVEKKEILVKPKIEKKETVEKPKAEKPVVVEKPKLAKKPEIKEKEPEPKPKLKPREEKPKLTHSHTSTPSESSSILTLLYYNFPTFAPNFDIVENEECKKQGHILHDQLHQHKLWALKMFDSSAKIPAGILKGNLNQFGDFDQCMSIFAKIANGDDDSETKISGKYCLADIEFEAEIPNMKLPVHLAQGRALIRSKIEDPGHFIPRFTTIRWGMCIPSGCTSEDAEKILENSIKLYNISSTVGLSFDVSVDTDQCTVRKPPKKLWEYPIETIITIMSVALLFLIVLLATLRDYRHITSQEEGAEEPVEKNGEESTLEKVFMCFSLKRTIAELLGRDSDPDEIKSIHGIRTICTFVLYVAHKLIPIGHLPFNNKTHLTETANNPMSIILRLSIIYTDSFLLLSGILTAYRMSKDIEDKGYIPWFNRIVARFIRLTPSLLVILIYYAYVMEFLGDGPLWNTIVTPNAELCKDNWWRNILYIQNIYPFQDMCATHTHQLALDMQLSLFAPILVWLLYRRPMMGVFITLLLHSISVVLRYYTTLNYRLSLVIYHGISISQLYRTANMMYASSIHRATPYLAGIGLGVLLRQMKPNFSMPKVLSILGWLVAGYFASWALYTPSHLASRTYQYNIQEAAQFSALCSLAWALALSWLIFSCFADNGGFINVFLSSRPMVLLSKISYTFYLTQFIVFFYYVGTVRTSSEFKINTSLDLTELGIIIIFAILLTLLVDTPVQKIKGILLRSASKPKENEAEAEVETEEEIITVREPEERECENNINKLTVQFFNESQKADEDEEEPEKSEELECETYTVKLISQLSTESQKSEEAEEDEEES